MKFTLKKIIILLYISFIYSYVLFPLNNNKNLSSVTNPNEFIEKIRDSDSHIIINIGSLNISVKAYLDISRNELMIAGDGIKNNIYNESISESYKCIYCKNKDFSFGWYSEGIISTEDFYIKNNISGFNIIHNMKYILGKRSIYMDPPEGICGLQLPIFGTEPDYNLINSLKNANVTHSYNWYLDYSNFPNKESKLIIDGFPHDLNSKKYNSEKFLTTKAISLKKNENLIWALRFSDIFYNKINLDIQSIEGMELASIQFDLGVIVAPNEINIILEKEFFGDYLNKNICFKDNQTKNTFIYCKNDRKFDIKQFKNICFKSVELNIIFELSYKELFYVKEDYIYFLILFRDIKNWIFGELFLKKYHLVFNQEDKTIGYYQDIEEISNEKRNKFKFNLAHILLIVIILSIIVVGIILYTKKGKRKNRANELDDDYEYKESINEENEKNKIIE